MSVTIFGIKNCDTIKKARSWLEANGVPYSFHDYKVSGIDCAHLKQWCDAAGWETVLNQAGTTFRKLEESEKVYLSLNKAIALMRQQPSMIKRPVLETDGKITVGFKPETYQCLFS